VGLEEKAEILAAPERREAPRLSVDEEALLLPVNFGSPVLCRIVELSLTGCRMSLRERSQPSIEGRVEALFKVRGIAFRISGVTEWSDDRNLVGIRFAAMAPRRRDELVEVLCEVAVENAAKAVKKAAEEQAAEETGRQPAANSFSAQDRKAEAPIPRPGPVLVPPLPAGPASAPPAPVPRNAPQAGQPAPQPVARERRAQSRHEVDTSAIILLIKIGSQISGRILDLSLGGCRIRTGERFPVGIYTRVETEFRLQGLPFRLGGVIQAVHDRDRRLVGIRFLDVSERKRTQVEQLIVEIEEMRARQKLAGPADAGSLAAQG